MYLYLYDSFLNNKKFDHILARIETRLTDLEIGGKIVRLSPLKNIVESVEDEIKNGVKTIIVVGNNKTLSQVVNIVAKYNDVTLGLIPVGPENEIAQSLGIPKEAEACDTLSARRIEKIDLGKINNSYFISSIKIALGPIVLKCEENYQIASVAGQNQIDICNLQPIFLKTSAVDNQIFNPRDGFLEIIFRPNFSLSQKILKIFKKENQDIKKSIFHFKKLDILGKNSSLIITEGGGKLKAPAHVEVAPKKLKIIVGKDRLF